jgi:flavin reductase (DIM6/NTAB) family NADH-FMN oxidoreductase RutF
LATTASDSGVPILRNCLAWLDCKVVTKCETGDRIYFLADVVAGGCNSDGQPLRERELFAAANAEQLAILSANRQADADALRSNSRLWRAKFANL